MDHDTQQDIAKSRLRHIEPLGSSVEVPYRSSHETITGQPVETSARSSLAINCETSTMRTSVRPKGSTPKARNSDGSAAKMLYSFDEAIHSNLKVEVASTLPTSQHHRGKETYGGREIEKIVHLKLTKTCHVWKWEMITWLMGSFAFIANLILLTWFNGTLQKDWNCRIQITTFVAALAQASQSALLVPITSSMAQLRWRWVSSCSRPAEDIEIFDLASRGPYGSVALLWHFAWKQQLASIGALSTILLLGFPTFIQQAIQLDTKEVEVITKSIPVDYYFTPVPERINVSSHQELSQSPWFSIGSTVLPEFKTNIERALMDNAAASSERNFGNLCKSDKCAWEQYPVLSICSRVENVSDSILFDDQYSILFGDPYTIPKPPHAAIEGQNFTEIGAAPVPYQIPYDSEFHIQTKFFAADRLNSSDDPTGLLQTRATPNNTMTHMSDVAHVYLTHWNSCRAPNYKDSHEKPQLWWSAYKATFSLCVQTYKTSYNVSGWHTATLAQYLDLEWHSVKKSSKGQEDQASSGDLDVMRCAHWPEDANLDPSLRKPSCIHEKMLRLIGGQLATSLDIKANLSGDPFGYKGDSQWTSILVSDVIGDCSDTKGMRGFAARTEKIAMSLTESFLVGGGAYPVQGMAYQREGAIKVNFFWLILPSTLYLLLSWFLFATMYQTSDLPPWKYSTLAVLWCKEGSSNRPSKKKQMEARGKQAKVQLVEEDDAWRLVETYEMS